MRPLLWFCLVLIPGLAAAPASASVCDAAPAGKGAQPRWRVDHYVYDASLKREWKVLVDCDDPGAPTRMELAPKGASQPARGAANGATINTGARARSSAPNPARTLARSPEPAPAIDAEGSRRPSTLVKAGSAVEVTGAPNAAVRILLAGTAMQDAPLGRPVRVRLGLSGQFVRGIVRGPHSVELVAPTQLSWGRP